jgi:cytidylate kinase
MIITITGVPGAGKSTVATMLSQRLKIPWYSMGDLRGKMAIERGITIDELNAIGERKAFTDKDVDDYQAKLGREQDNFIMEGRLSWHFIPQSLKIFLDVDANEAARRIFDASKQGLRPDEKPYASSQEVKDRVAARLASDSRRYQKYYNVDYLNRSNYDLVIDTTNKDPEVILSLILARLDENAPAGVESRPLSTRCP